ncbi:MAG TPA: RNA 2',3'-cyclic phosphodiesterase [Gemmatimonadaceae bacterium]
MRLFLAINLPREVRREVHAATSSLRDCVPELAWVAEPSLHLTLKFLGDQPEDQLAAIQRALAGIAGSHSELLMTAEDVGAFPNFRRTRIVWMGIFPEPRLELLHHDIEVAFQQLGFEVEGRPFRPHVTLARVRSPLAEDQVRLLRRTAKRIEFRREFIVRSIDVMRSTPRVDGSEYATLVSAPLRSG